jgi:hypothetical protein
MGRMESRKKLGRGKLGLVASLRRLVSLERFCQDNQKRRKLLDGDAVPMIAEKGEKDQSSGFVLKDEAPVTEYVLPLPAVVEQREAEEPAAKPDVPANPEKLVSPEQKSADAPVVQAIEPVVYQLEVGVVASVTEPELEIEADEHVVDERGRAPGENQR